MNIPELKEKPFYKSTFQLFKTPLDFCEKILNLDKEIIKVRIGPEMVYIVLCPQLVRQILVQNNSNYVRTKTHKVVSKFLGNGLLTSEGDYWLKQRKLIQPIFHTNYLTEMSFRMKQGIEEQLETLVIPKDGNINVSSLIIETIFQVVIRTLFGLEKNTYHSSKAKPLDDILKFLYGYAQSVVKIPLWFPIPEFMKFKRNIKLLDNWVYEIITNRRNHPTEIPNILDMLLNARDSETGEKMTDRQIRDEVMTLVMAGHDTTSSVLMWTVWLLSQNNNFQDEAREEIVSSQIHDKAGNSMIKLILQESMRLYPPAWIFGRKSVNDEMLGNYYLPKKSNVIISPYLLHRRGALWKNPTTFDPKRFVGVNIIEKGFIPFGAGPRVCIGNRYAQMEMEIFLTSFLKKFKINYCVNKITPNPFGSLKPNIDIVLNVHRVDF